jgi:hypothetical protein
MAEFTAAVTIEVRPDCEVTGDRDTARAKGDLHDADPLLGVR